jgi:hypothetical protein
MIWTGLVAFVVYMRSACKILVENPEWKTSLRRPRCGWEDKVKTDPKSLGCENVD